MEVKTVVNTANLESMPIDIGTIEYLQNNALMLSVLGAIAGDKVILYEEGSGIGIRHGAGYAYLKTPDCPEGEILSFTSGSNDGYLRLQTEDIDITAIVDTETLSFTKLYQKRWLQSATSGDYKYRDFVKIDNICLKSLVEKLKDPTPVGSIITWGGNSNNLPATYRLCDGSDLKIEEFTELYDVIGDIHQNSLNNNNNSVAVQAGYFRLPNLTGRFIVGQNRFDEGGIDPLNTIGATGGEKRHTLTIDEMPSHDHNYNFVRSAIKASPGTAISTPHEELTRTTSSTGGDTSHQNMPPYYVLSYIIKVQ